jgi:hypothetical protein
MKRFFSAFVVVFFLVASTPVVQTARADVITLWNFNSAPADSSSATGTNFPSLGVGTASLVGNATATYAGGSTNDPASDNTGWNTAGYPAPNASNKTAGVQFNVSTLGYSNIVIRWDHRVSNTASKYYRLQYSIDGTTFTDFSSPIALLSSGSTFEPQTNSLGTISGVNNNFNFAFRIVSEFEFTATGSGTNGYVPVVSTNNYGSSGTVRYDMVTISGTPIPGANTPPGISSISNQTIRVNQSTGLLPFTIGDAEDPATSLTLNKGSTDQTVIPNTSIGFGGSGSNRTVNVSAGSQMGSSVVTVYVIDTGGRSNSTSFSVTVLPLNTPPVISSFAPTNTIMNTATAPIPFTIGDLETAASSLSLSGTSANTALVPNANIVFGGSGSNRTVTITPAANQTGVAVITVTVGDGTYTAGSVFPVMVTPSTNVIFYEPFSYADGSLVTNSGSLWRTRSGTVGQCQVTNGQLQVSSAQTEDPVGDLIGGPYQRSNSFVLYAGMKVTFLSLPKAVPGMFASFADGSVLRGRIYCGTTNAAAGAFRVQVANGSDAPIEWAADLNPNVTYALVTRYDLDAAVTKLWLNPTAETDPSVTGTDAQSAAQIASYGFRQDTDIGATILVDDLRVGFSFAAVLPGSSPAGIPLSLQRRSNSVVLSWTDSSFVLQSAPVPTGVFTNVPGASSPYTNPITGKANFFRLKK